MGAAACLIALSSVNGADSDGVLAGNALSTDHSMQWRLPDKLNEISGLAMSGDQRLFAITDERAIIYELDYENGKLVKAFALGKPVERGDFEGITVIDQRIFLTTSDGEIYSSQEGDDGEHVEFDSFETGLGRQCEIEGLAHDSHGRLLLACKKLRKSGELRSLAIFVWSPATEKLLDDERIDIPERDIRRAIRSDRINPSGIVVNDDGNLLLVASRQRALVELTADGALLSTGDLPSTRHRQAEGIELTELQHILIADEGGSHKARLAIYWPEAANIHAKQ